VKGKKPDTCTRSVDPRAGSLHSPLRYHRALRGRDSATPKLLPHNRSVSIPARKIPSCPQIAGSSFDLFKSSRPRSSTFAGPLRVDRTYASCCDRRAWNFHQVDDRECQSPLLFHADETGTAFYDHGGPFGVAIVSLMHRQKLRQPHCRHAYCERCTPFPRQSHPTMRKHSTATLARYQTRIGENAEIAIVPCRKMSSPLRRIDDISGEKAASTGTIQRSAAT